MDNASNILSANRLKSAQETFNITTQDLMELWEVGASSVSEKRSARQPITYDQACRLEEHYGIQVEWLLRGAGPMKLGEPLLREPEVETGNPFSRDQVARRLEEQCHSYEHEWNINKKSMAHKLGVSYSHMLGMRDGSKPITVGMLSGLVRIGFNVNYTLGQRGSLRQGEKLKTSNDAVMAELKEMRELLAGRAQRKAS